MLIPSIYQHVIQGSKVPISAHTRDMFHIRTLLWQTYYVELLAVWASRCTREARSCLRSERERGSAGGAGLRGSL